MDSYRKTSAGAHPDHSVSSLTGRQGLFPQQAKTIRLGWFLLTTTFP